MEIANLVISILSLIATIAISFVIYFLERNNQKEARSKEIKEDARKFIINNADELEYLHWATIAVGCFPQNKHVRKIYNEFAYLDDETKQEVLKQRHLDCVLIDNAEWIDLKIEEIRSIIDTLGIGDDFLYDGGKYFVRAYDYKDKSIEDLEHARHSNYKFKDVFKLGRMFQHKNGNLTYEQYLEDFLYCKFKKPDKFPKDIDIPLPNDYLIEAEDLRNCSEDYLCYWIMVMIRDVIAYAIRYLNYDTDDHSQTDAQAETYEDKYFSVLYELYYLNNNKK